MYTTKGREETSKKEYYATQEPMAGDAKLVVLVNGGSASASEIFAGAIQDHDRGVILGTKSFGKGLVQTITPLDYNTSLKITTAKYYTPSGRCIQKIDYSKGNDVIVNTDSLIKAPYPTDNDRVVYGAGGITPDTTVEFSIDGDLTMDLLAKGLFFKFADYYYYRYPDEKFSSISNEKLIDEFTKYLKDNNFVYKSESEKQLDEVIADANKKKLNEKVIADLEDAQNSFEALDNGDLSLYKNEILIELRGELASRYLGAEGRIEELLKYDEQFQAAYKVVSNTKVYDRLLNIK